MMEEHPLRPPFHWVIRSDSMQGLTSKSKEIRTMTKEEILAMVPGRELDRLVGKFVMELDVVEDTLPQLPKYYLPEYERTIFTDVPLFSSEISAAWKVAEKFPIVNISRVEIFEKFPHHAVEIFFDMESNEPSRAEATTAPEAICKAALLAVMEAEVKES